MERLQLAAPVTETGGPFGVQQQQQQLEFGTSSSQLDHHEIIHLPTSYYQQTTDDDLMLDHQVTGSSDFAWMKDKKVAGRKNNHSRNYYSFIIFSVRNSFILLRSDLTFSSSSITFFFKRKVFFFFSTHKKYLHRK